MSVRLARRRPPKTVNAAGLRKWAMLFLVIAIVGRGIFETGFGINGMNNDELLNAMNVDPNIMAAVTASIFCRMLESCGVLLYAFLLVEGFRHTSRFEKYLVRVGAVALIAELPYNLVMSGKVLMLGTRNPAFGLVIGLVMLYFYQRYAQRSVKDVLMKVLITVAALLWCVMLRIDHGVCLLIMVATFWFFREKSNFRAIIGFGAAMFCTVLDMYYIGACLSAIFLHRYDEERGEQNMAINYGVYPVVLLIIGIAAKFI